MGTGIKICPFHRLLNTGAVFGLSEPYLAKKLKLVLPFSLVFCFQKSIEGVNDMKVL